MCFNFFFFFFHYFSWNFAFKNQITSLQSQAKNRANPNRAEVQANLALFLEAASGFYTQVVIKTCHFEC